MKWAAFLMAYVVLCGWVLALPMPGRRPLLHEKINTDSDVGQKMIVVSTLAQRLSH